ncbi:MAG: transposase [Desulfohalobiaceae bacterium]
MDMQDVIVLADKQRVFRARQKLQAAGYVSHITQRAAGKEPLFLEARDYLDMLGLLKDAAHNFDLQFYAFCLMPNHVHLLLEPNQANLSKAMHSIFSRYAKRFNQKYERRGHIFGGPYRQAICLDNSYLLAASVYIHLNPVRAGLTNKALDYRWSTCSLYCSSDPPASFVDPGPVLVLLDEQDQAQARKHYTTILQEASQEEPENALEQEGAITGLLSRLASMFPRLFKRLAKPGGQEGDSQQKILDLVELEEELQNLASGKPRSPQTLQARKYLVQQLAARGYKQTEIAQKLQLSRKTIYNILRAPS